MLKKPKCFVRCLKVTCSPSVAPGSFAMLAAIRRASSLVSIGEGNFCSRPFFDAVFLHGAAPSECLTTDCGVMFRGNVAIKGYDDPWDDDAMHFFDYFAIGFFVIVMLLAASRAFRRGNFKL
jgi:hypothetical protein